MSEELKPCPFCGQLPELTKHFKHDAWGLMHRCPVIGPISFEFGDRRRHVATWNRRTPGPATAKMVAKIAWFVDHFGRDGDLEVPIKREMAAALIAEHEPA